MIKVTDAMLNVVNDYNSKTRTMTDTELAKRIIELHEANKPKPAPVGYYAPNLDAPPFNRGVLDAMYSITGNWIPLYATPPTREPLSEDTLWHMWVGSLSDALVFARSIEKAHGIGATE